MTTDMRISKIKKQMFLGGAILWYSFGFASELRNYAYLARRVPPVVGENCHSQAQALARKFSKITGLEARGSCETADPKGNDLLIRYQAFESLNVVSSVPDLDSPGRGFEFPSQSDCESQIAAESAHFQKETGTEPILAFCQFRENYYGLRRWALILEGFGNPDRSIAWSSSLVPGQPDRGQVAAIKKAVKEKFSQVGLNIRFVFLQDDEKGHLRLNVFYYGKYSEQVKGFTLAALNSLNDCHQALLSFQKVESSKPELPSVATCIHNPYRHGADLFVVADVLRWFKVQHAAESFASSEQCHLEKEGLVEFYKKQVSPFILEGFCTEWGPQWKINLISTSER